MDLWQIVLLVFFALLPVVLMLDFWGDERLDSRGKPRRREWPSTGRSRDDEHLDDQAGHDQLAAH